MAARIVPAGDAALVLAFEARIDPRVNARAVWAARALREAAITGVRDVVSTYHAVTVYIDPLRTDFERLQRALAEVAQSAPDEPANEREPHPIPVCYEEECGPDLEAVAMFAGCSVEEVIELHARRVYRVYMLGFVPGFSYMGIVDPRIAVPRRATPRDRVPAGSVGIAGPQTGIYPAATPGGWHIVGRTPVKPFDLARADAFLLRPGDLVRFEPISLERFRDVDAQGGVPAAGQ